MKKQILSILLCALCVACNDFEEEIGYTLNVGPSKITIDENSITKTSYSARLSTPISLVDGKADISEVYFKVNDERVEAKCEKKVYYMDYKFMLGSYYSVKTIAVINGVEQTLDYGDVNYMKKDFEPYGRIELSVEELGKFRFTLDLHSSSGLFPPSSDVKVIIGNQVVEMRPVNATKFVCDVDMYDTENWDGYASYQLTNVFGVQKSSRTGYMGGVKIESVADYDMSNDGKEIDGCIYLAGTKWAKGVMDTDGKLTADSELGEVWDCRPHPIPEYDSNDCSHFQGTENDPVRKNLGEGWMTPSPTQIQNLFKRCSRQEVNVGTKESGLLLFPGKNGKRIICNKVMPVNLAKIREQGVYVKKDEYYGTDKVYRRSSNWIQNSVAYWRSWSSKLELFYSDRSYFYILPIKE